MHVCSGGCTADSTRNRLLLAPTLKASACSWEMDAVQPILRRGMDALRPLAQVLFTGPRTWPIFRDVVLVRPRPGQGSAPTNVWGSPAARPRSDEAAGQNRAYISYR